MYKIFGSKEVFNDDVKEVASVKLKSCGRSSTVEFGEGKNSIKIICISDSHSSQDRIKVPECDLLIIAGDILNNKDGEKEMKSFCNWLDNIKCKNKIIVAGNHDKYLEKKKSKIKEIFPTSIYLENNSFQLKDPNLLIYGSPITIKRNLFYFGNAFSVTGEEMKREWAKIPENTDILITHVPPYDILDITYKHEHVGSKWLRNEICNRIQPKIHIFGHNHDSHEYFTIGEFKNGKKCLFVNACVMYKTYSPCIIEYRY